MKACKHRYIKGYDDGDGRWDWNCLECDGWPDYMDMHPAYVSWWSTPEDEWRRVFVENLREMREYLKEMREERAEAREEQRKKYG